MITAKKRNPVTLAIFPVETVQVDADRMEAGERIPALNVAGNLIRITRHPSRKGVLLLILGDMEEAAPPVGARIRVNGIGYEVENVTESGGLNGKLTRLMVRR